MPFGLHITKTARAAAAARSESVTASLLDLVENAHEIKPDKLAGRIGSVAERLYTAGGAKSHKKAFAIVEERLNGILKHNIGTIGADTASHIAGAAAAAKNEVLKIGQLGKLGLSLRRFGNEVIPSKGGAKSAALAPFNIAARFVRACVDISYKVLRAPGVKLVAGLTLVIGAAVGIKKFADKRHAVQNDLTVEGNQQALLASMGGQVTTDDMARIAAAQSSGIPVGQLSARARGEQATQPQLG